MLIVIAHNPWPGAHIGTWLFTPACALCSAHVYPKVSNGVLQVDQSLLIRRVSCTASSALIYVRCGRARIAVKKHADRLALKGGRVCTCGVCQRLACCEGDTPAQEAHQKAHDSCARHQNCACQSCHCLFCLLTSYKDSDDEKRGALAGFATPKY